MPYFTSVTKPKQQQPESCIDDLEVRHRLVAGVTFVRPPDERRELRLVEVRPARRWLPSHRQFDAKALLNQVAPLSLVMAAHDRIFPPVDLELGLPQKSPASRAAFITAFESCLNCASRFADG